MRKIGIVTFHKAHNYGAMLQAYALEKKLISKGKNDVEIINYYSDEIYSNYRVIRPLCKNPLKSLKHFIDDIVLYKKRRLRFNVFEKFLQDNFEMSKEYKEEKQIKNEKFLYDVLITGSDQVWNPKIVGELSDVYTLNFSKDNVKKISYAASVGSVDYIDEYKEKFIKTLDRLDYISVREDDACKSLNNLTDKKVERVIDPTLLLSKEEWNNTLNNIEKLNNKYIVAYVVEPDDEYIRIVNDLSDKTGLPVVHFGIKNPGYKNVLKSAYTEGPLEFVNYIKNAEYVVATSFHATVFSIIFNKKFFVVPHRKTGARVTNLLDLLNIENRAFYDFEEFKNIDYTFDTDWNEVNKKLEEEREKSINWLKNAIEG